MKSYGEWNCSTLDIQVSGNDFTSLYSQIMLWILLKPVLFVYKIIKIFINVVGRTFISNMKRHSYSAFYFGVNFFAISWMQDVIIKSAVSSAAELLTICSFAMEANEHVNTNKKY